MKRRDFLAHSRALGLPLLGGFAPGCAGSSSQLYWDFQVNFSGKVLVIGAGASGLAAGYLLDRYGIDFEILEASTTFGGRIKRAPDFADFPIDLGAEWIHQHPSILAELVDDPSASTSIDVVPYSPETISLWTRDGLRRRNWFSNFYSEYKFRRTTWYGFLETQIVPGIADRIRTETPVQSIDYSGEPIVVTDQSGNIFEADRVVVTVPIAVLQSGAIEFTPALDEGKQAAIDRVHVPPGLKVFLEFSERFYPDLLIMNGLLADDFADKLYYDAAFRKDSDRHVMGLFCVGPPAVPYTDLDDRGIFESVMDELDAIFGGRASASYRNHIVQHWTQEPYIRGAYSTDLGPSADATIDALLRPADDRVFFCGEAMSRDNGSTVPGAMESAYAVIETVLRK